MTVDQVRGPLGWIACAGLGLCAPAQADPAGAVSAQASFRLRMETVSQDGKPADATALTLRSLLGVQTRPIGGLSATVQLGAVTVLNSDYDDFKAGLPNPARAGRPRIVDPAFVDLNNVHADWVPAEGVLLRAGRQAFKLDNSRHVGTVEFRQTMQAMDGVLLEARSLLPRTTVTAGSFAGVRQITTRYQPADIRLLNVKHSLPGGTQLGAYGYFVGWERASLAAASSRTVGLRLDGRLAMEDVDLLYSAELASQEKWRNGTAPGATHYRRLGLGLQHGPSSLRIEQEVLGSNAGRNAFQSPLGSNHIFQGWADLYLVTPDSGIDDRYVVASHRHGALQLQAEYHVFRADERFTSLQGKSQALGHELDLGASWTRGAWQAKLELARFNEGAPYGNTLAAPGRKRDTSKLWLGVQYSR